MFALLLLIPSAASDDIAGFRLPPAPVTVSRIVVPCVGDDCAAATRKEDYRIPLERDSLARTSKERAFAADGQQCGLVGDKYCTSRGRKIFSTDFSE
ncbi:hypothetical protein M9979_10270 [Sphingomonas sp. RP10(2022)]|uniref:Uncharacterized protein n=1 Tax=Sphingomonas liriopis TaxID=2949094 RepID=A0A9X2HTM1_9SPHN|nr:hypothetical protein [Sphingomonas liriopis]MCP3735254.1 hypothetical protein [Sphingomonas liriopis]